MGLFANFRYVAIILSIDSNLLTTETNNVWILMFLSEARNDMSTAEFLIRSIIPLSICQNGST